MRILILCFTLSIGNNLSGQITDSIATPYGEFVIETTDSLDGSTGFVDHSSATSDGGTADFVEIISGARMMQPPSEVIGMSISLFPNPGFGDIQLTIAGIESLIEISVCDLTGRVVYSSSCQVQGILCFVLPSTHWTAGAYIVTVRNGQQQSTEQLIISGRNDKQ